MRLKNILWKLAAMAVATGIGSGMMAGPAQAEETKPETAMEAYYSGYFYGHGWGTPRGDNTLCAAPAGSYVTAVKASLSDQPEGMSGTLAYQVNVSGTGWIGWTENYEVAGGETEFPLEAVRMKLTGELVNHYDVYYSVLQSGNWTEWSKNEETAGVEGQGLRVDGIRISIVVKGGEAPPAQPAAGSVDPSRPMVALTFDDGPSSEVTGRILNMLEAHGGRATFFMVGNRVPGTAATVNRMSALGCEVGNHTYDHKYLTKLGDAGIRASVGQTNTNIANACGVSPVLMRPTGGYYNASSLATLGSMGMSAIMWSIDTRDWQHRNPQKTIQSVLDHVRDGDIILMHDIYGTTADAAETIIPELTARGYQLVTVSEMAALRGGLAPGQVYNSFRP